MKRTTSLPLIGTREDWHANRLEYLRYDYTLDNHSVVVDVGGCVGEFTEPIFAKFNCHVFVFEPVMAQYEFLLSKFGDNPKIVISPLALSNTNDEKTIYTEWAEDTFISPTMHIVNQHPQNIQCVTMDRLGFKFIDLLKINIEGEEYALLEDMIDKNLLGICDNIQVQFHDFVDGHEKRYAYIRKRLEETHYPTYLFPFTWENWRLKDKSYSQVGQDKWVLSILKNKGFFLDLGCKNPRYINNTLLLEENGWDGLSIDINDYSKEWESRKTNFVCADALTLDYSKMALPNIIDYLSLDIDGNPDSQLIVMKRLFDLGFSFRAITVEHNSFYIDEKKCKIPQRELLIKNGYTLSVPDVTNDGYVFEDWFVNNSLFYDPSC